MIRLYASFLLLFFSALSNASTLTYWSPNIQGTTIKAATALDACKQGWPNTTSAVNKQWRIVSPTSNSGSCEYTDSFYTQWLYRGQVSKITQTCEFGDNGSQCNSACPSPNTMVDGQCIAPPPDPCLALYGQSKNFVISGNASDPGAFYQPVPGSDFWNSPDTVILGGCAATPNFGTKCKVYGDGEYSCTGTATYQGYSTTPSEGTVESDECAEGECPDTEPTPTSEGSSDCTQWIYDGEGRRTRSCQTTAEANKPGQAKCLTDGSLVCVSPSPTPEKDTKTRIDDVKETPGADGGKTTETTSTTNKTYCAAGACTTTTTTNKTTVVTNGSGEVTSESGTCEGDDCGDPQTPEEENDEAPEQAELPQVGEDDDPGYGESLSDFTGRIQNSPMISAVSNIAFPSGGGSCSMGSVSLWGGSISFDHFCSMAAPVLGGLRYLFLSIWAIAAVRLFMTA